MESSPLLNLGGSLPVPSVQEMVKGRITQVPPRYVHPTQGPTFISNTDVESQLPIIDMERLTCLDFKGSEELEKLDRACKDWGFFQLINHGVNSSLITKVKHGIEEFFNLPIEEKNKYKQLPGDIEGFGQGFVVSEEQKLDWADMFYIFTLPTHIRKPHLLPKLPHQLREGIEAYAVELEKLALKMLEYMAKALKIDANEIRAVYEGGLQGMRMNYYPPCPQPDLVIGLSSHSDIQGITILLELNEVEGLQIKKDGRWFPVKPLSNAFIVNLGDSLEIVTNGIYKSIEYRATVNSTKERLSIATFYSPNLEREVRPAPNLITPQNPAMYKSIKYGDLVKLFVSSELKGKSCIEQMKIQHEERKID
ncbi:hypothetical protein Nepgr_021272 [Nepenthes gracilis]|uniref:Fe2OG dioxygenase domain-containing protein n=1 Tax=Nepenthes gracilis TaxID=150966 RepID=A0AAD3T0I7_NEPGR|nr:hypothetical protein Nepgr_021272 [Nepenthes gracilis]